MYDVTRPITFRNIEKWYNLLQEHVRGDVEVAIVSISFGHQIFDFFSFPAF